MGLSVRTLREVQLDGLPGLSPVIVDLLSLGLA